MEVDPDAVEKLMITRTDFIHALQNDIKPVSKTVVYKYYSLSNCSQDIKSNL